MCKVVKTNTKNGKVEKGYKFSWIELIVNTKTGETSATGFCGIILIGIPIILFTVMTIWYFFNMSHSAEIFELMDKLITLISIGAGLLGLRKISSNFADGSKFIIGGKEQDTGVPKKKRGSHQIEEEENEEDDE